MALLVMFIAYALQVHHRPYMSPGDRLEVVERHEERAKDESIKKNVDRTLAARLAEVSARVRRPTKKVTWDASASRLSNVTQLARSFFVNYNTVEAILLSCAVLVCLAGIMFQSGRFSNNLFTEQRDLIMYCTLLVVFFSLICEWALHCSIANYVLSPSPPWAFISLFFSFLRPGRGCVLGGFRVPLS